MSEKQNLDHGSSEATATANSATPTKRWKKVLSAVGLAVLLILAALFLFRDLFIPHVVPQVGSTVLGTKMEIENFSSSLLMGKVELRGLSIANPDGFSDDPAFFLDHVYISVFLPSLLTDEIVINEILISGMNVNVEFGLTGTNLGKIQDNLKNNLPEPAEKADQPKKADPDDRADSDAESAGKELIIDKLTIENNQITVANVPLLLAPIRMTEVGRGQSLNETVNDIFGAIVKATMETIQQSSEVTGKAIKDMGQSLSGHGETLKDKVLDLFK